MIRLAVIGTQTTGKSAVVRALAAHGIHAVEHDPLSHASKRLRDDAYLLVCDKDLIDVDYEQITFIARANRPIGVALNKSDTYSASQLRQLLQHIRRRLRDLVPPERVVACSADPVRITWRQTSEGYMEEHARAAPRDVSSLLQLATLLIDEAAQSLRVRARVLASHLPLAFRSK